MNPSEHKYLKPVAFPKHNLIVNIITSRKLGVGGFGVVFLGFKKDDESQPYAVKYI